MNTKNDVPIELEEQAQLLEQQYRDAAIDQMYSSYRPLPGIKQPADVVDGECEECGETIPAARVKALMKEFTRPNPYSEGSVISVWKAHPSSSLCINCAEFNDNKKRLFGR